MHVNWNLKHKWQRNFSKSIQNSSKWKNANQPLFVLGNDPLKLSKKPPKKGKLIAGAEEKADIKYLSKIDKNFKKRLNDWLKSGRDLNIIKTQETGTLTLNEAEPKGPSSGSGLENYLYYTAIEGPRQGTYLITTIVFQELFSKGVSLSAGESKYYDIDFIAEMPDEIFDKFNTFKPHDLGMDGYEELIYQSLEKKTDRISLRIDNNKPPIIDSDGNEHDNPLNLVIKATASSKPIIVKMPIGSVGKTLWNGGQVNYKLNKGEKTNGEILYQLYPEDYDKYK
jgi:hypothetical protein